MSLRFETLSLKNFGPYREINELNLEADPDAPIVVIHGENTVGKTRIFRALRWCLYGSPEAAQTQTQALRSLIEYLNLPASREGETDMQVSMRFTANGHTYHLTRTAHFDGRLAQSVRRPSGRRDCLPAGFDRRGDRPLVASADLRVLPF